jgi:hypothetical protein
VETALSVEKTPIEFQLAQSWRGPIHVLRVVPVMAITARLIVDNLSQGPGKRANRTNTFGLAGWLR